MMFETSKPAPPMRDAFDAKAVEIVKDWLRSMMSGVMIYEHDIPNVHMNPPTCTDLAMRIADCLRQSATGQGDASDSKVITVGFGGPNARD